MTYKTVTNKTVKNKICSSSIVRLSVLASLMLLAPILVVDSVSASSSEKSHGAEDSSHGDAGHSGLGTLLWPTVNFLAYAFIIGKIYRKSGPAALINRRVEMEQRLSVAANQLDISERSLAEVKRRYSDIEAEKTALISALMEEGERSADLIADKADQQVETSKLDTKRLISNELAKANLEISREVISRATASARSELQQGLSAEVDARLRRETIEGLLIG